MNKSDAGAVGHRPPTEDDFDFDYEQVVNIDGFGVANATVNALQTHLRATSDPHILQLSKRSQLW